MPGKSAPLPELTFHPLTSERWDDLEALFGPRGAYGGCWCMYWRLKRSQWNAQVGDANKQAFKEIVDTGHTPGILAYAGDQAVGWCAVAPREEFPPLERTRVARRVDDQPVWSVVCFFVARPYRRRGVTAGLLQAAVEYVRSRGGRIIEGYPTCPGKQTADAWIYMGHLSTFQKAGFVEAARPTPARSIMRCELDDGDPE